MGTTLSLLLDTVQSVMFIHTKLDKLINKLDSRVLNGELGKKLGEFLKLN